MQSAPFLLYRISFGQLKQVVVSRIMKALNNTWLCIAHGYRDVAEEPRSGSNYLSTCPLSPQGAGGQITYFGILFFQLFWYRLL
jgi:hypothetical protein